jgi:hypothetical protein
MLILGSVEKLTLEFNKIGLHADSFTPTIPALVGSEVPV